jgi:hypothetical protein
VGCDSHVYIEVKGRNGRWGLREDKERYRARRDRENLDYNEMRDLWHPAVEYLTDRNYRLFAALADVRNSGDSIKPLFPNRGVPLDASKAALKRLDCCDYHSHTYFTLQELMDVDWDEHCCAMKYGLLADEYLEWKETGEIPEKADEYPFVRSRFWDKEPFHREVSEEEMTLLLLADGPKKLVRKLTFYKKKKERGGPYVGVYQLTSYRRLLPGLPEIIPSLAEMGPPQRVRVLIAFDN